MTTVHRRQPANIFSTLWCAIAVTAVPALAGASTNECLDGRLERLSLYGTSLAAERFDPDTGRDLRNYAPDRLVDYKHMRLALDIPDMDKPVARGNQQLSFEVIGKPLGALRLNAVQLDIERVGFAAVDKNIHKVSFHHEDDVLTASFTPPLPVGREFTLAIDYTIDHPSDGLFWTTSSPEWPGRPPQIHTQGQPETNRHWFPAHDSPNERLTTELLVTVPSGFEVISNGHLLSSESRGGRTMWHWDLDHPHVTYLVTLVVGKFATVDVAPDGAKVRMPVHVPEQWGDRAEPTYKNTHAMLEIFEERFDEPYPWGDRYAQVVVWNFGAGGMENTTVSSMYDTAVLDDIALAERDLDGLISHELAHQWFGDMLTCNTWAHIWLNEGWATYSTSLWFEARDGYNEGYLRNLHGSLRGLAERDQLKPGDDTSRPGMVSRVYEHPWEVFRRRSNPYPKGAAILHMLRMKLGEDLFFDAVAQYIDRYKYQSVETEDFRAVLEEVSGLSLEHFFHQWCDRPGTPKLDVKVSWNESAGELTIAVDQKQLIDAANPAFAFDLPIEVYEHNGTSEPDRRTITVEARRHTLTIPMGAKPEMVLIDPDLSVLAAVSLDMPRDMLIKQATSAGSLASRIEAAKELRDNKSSESAEALAAIVADADENYAVRAKAAESLGRLGRTDELTASLEAVRSGDPRVRQSVLSAIARQDTDAVYELIAPHAKASERSYLCRAEALEALGRSGDTRYLPVIRAGLEAESQHDQVRNAALKALAHFEDKQSLELATRYAMPGHYARTRPTAIDTVRKLNDTDPDMAYEALAPLLVDSTEKRTIRGLIDALSHIEDERALATLEAFADRTRDPRLAELATRAHERLAARLAGDESLEEAHTRIEHLEREIEKLRNEVEEKAKD